jgi:hypothetical protein
VPALALPRIQPDVVVVSTRRDKRRSRPQPLRQLKSQHAAIKLQRPLKFRHLQMHMPNPRSTRYRHIAFMIFPRPQTNAVCLSFRSEAEESVFAFISGQPADSIHSL